MKKLMVAVAGVACVGLAFGEAAGESSEIKDVWVSSSLKTSYKSAAVTDSAWWEDGYIPTNAGDRVHLAVRGRVGMNGNWWPSYPNQNITIDSIADGMGYTMLSFGGGTYTMRTMKDSRQITRCSGTFIPSTSAEPLVIENNNGNGGVFTAKPVGEDDEVRVERFGAQGRIVKEGAGTLSFGSHVDPLTTVKMNAGTVRLGGKEYDSLTPGMYAHVDAGQTNRFAFVSVAGDDRKFISNIYASPAGGTGAPYFRPMPWTEQGIPADKFAPNKPWLSETTVNGVRLIDFGPLVTGWNGETGKNESTGETCGMYTAGVLHCQPDPLPVREIFFVAEFTTLGSATTTSLLDYSKGAYAFSTRYFVDNQGEYLVKNDTLRWRSDIRVDGMPYFNLTDSQQKKHQSQLRVYSISTTNLVTEGVRYFGGAPGSKSFGGFRLAEMVVYTNILTQADRRRNIEYLMKRWHAPDSAGRYAWDMGRIEVAAANTSVQVAEDEVAHVRRLDMLNTPVGASLGKTGKGVLCIDRASPSSAIEVKEGGVRFIRQVGPVSDDPQPAANPYFHGDPSVDSSFIFEKDGDGNDTDRILAWQSKHGGTMWLTNSANAAVPKPVRTTRDGHAVIDFGTAVGNNAKGSSYLMIEKSTANGYGVNSSTKVINQSPKKMVEAFVVWRNNTGNGTANAQILGACYNSAMYRTGYNLLDSGSALDSYARMAEVAVDGVVVNPFSGHENLGQDDWVVVRISAPYRTYWSTIAARSEDNTYGGSQVGEVIVYDRILDCDERQNTEAYLLKKWKNAEHPDLATDQIASLAFAAGASNVIDSAAERRIGLLAASGTVFKRGAGAVTVEAERDVSDVAVEEGGLTLTVGEAGERLLDGSFYHFDAARADTLTTEQDGDVLRVTQWRDVRPTSTWNATGWTKGDHVLTYEKLPTLVEETIGGRTRTVVDFGAYQLVPTNGVANHYTVTGESSCLQIHATGTGSGWKNARETIVVCRDTDAQCRGELVAGWRGNLRRGASGKLFTGTAANASAYVEVDGEKVATDSVLPAGWHVIVIATTADYIPEALGGDCGQGSYFALGGLQIAECASFAATNTAAQRAQIRAYLMKKWLNRGDGFDVGSVGALSVAPGASLTVASPDYAKSPGIEGLSVVFDGSVPQPVAMGGAFDFSTAGALTVDFVSGLKPSRVCGQYAVFTAPSVLSPESFENWTQTINLNGFRGSASFVLKGNTIYLDVKAPGIYLMIR